MCRLLAKVNYRAESGLYELVEAQHSLKKQSARARLPVGYGAHNDGCGIAWLQDGALELVKRGKPDSWDSTFCSLVTEIKTPTFIAHNRAATSGLQVALSESHPYMGTWRNAPVAFCHNGEVRSFVPEAMERGVSDSRLFMEHFVSAVQEASVDSIGEYLSVAAQTWAYSSLNALVLTAEGVYAWRWYNDTPDSSFDRELYYSMHIRETSESVLLASEPVDESPEWRSVPNKTVIGISRDSSSIRVERRLFES